MTLLLLAIIALLLTVLAYFAHRLDMLQSKVEITVKVHNKCISMLLDYLSEDDQKEYERNLREFLSGIGMGIDKKGALAWLNRRK